MAVLPVVAVWLLRSAEIVESPWICLVLAMALSILLSSAGCAYWQRSQGSGDLLFSELLVWGLGSNGYAPRGKSLMPCSCSALLTTAQDTRRGDRTADQQQLLLRQLAGALDARSDTRGQLS